MKDHIRIKCKSTVFNFSRLKWIRLYLTKKTCNTLVMGLVIISHLDYTNGMLASLPEVDLSKLKRVQNMAAKIVYKKGCYDSVTECMYDLHWLPIHRRIQHLLLTQVYKCIRREAPGYHQELISENKPGRAGLCSSSTCCQLVVPHTKYKTFADRSFKVQGPVLWNQLPDHIRRIDFWRLKENFKTLFIYIRV